MARKGDKVRAELNMRTTRILLTSAFVSALQERFEEFGADAIKIVSIEEPATFLKLIATLVPKELSVELTHQFEDMTDKDIELTIERIRQMKEINPSPPLIEYEELAANGRGE